MDNALAILRELVEPGWAGLNQETDRCDYCHEEASGRDWEHAPDCPIRLGRELIQRIDSQAK